MDKPARLVIAAVETRPEQPEAPPLLVLDPVIIADRVNGAGAFRAPPFVGDPLRSVGEHDPMPAAAPHEPERRIVPQQPERHDRFGRVEQSGRPGPCSRKAPPFPTPVPPPA